MYKRHISQKSFAQTLKIAQNIGMNKKESMLLEQFCIKNGLDYTMVKPSKKTMTKLNSEQFKKMTGYSGRTSEHGRDAAMLVYGL